MMPTLRGVAIYAPPFVTSCADQHEQCDFPGKEVMYMRVLAEFIGCSLQVTIVEDPSDMVSLVVENKSDVSLFSLTANRLLSMNCTNLMFHGYDTYVLFMKGKRSERFEEGVVLQAFHWTVWLALLMAALGAWLIEEIKVSWFGIEGSKDIGLLIVWLMLSVCMNCYGSLVSISAYRSSDQHIEVNIDSLNELLDAVISDSCRIIHNDEYGPNFFIDIVEPILDSSKMEELKFALLRRPVILSETRVKVKMSLEATNSCLVAIDYSSMVPYFRLQSSDNLKVFELPQLSAEPYYFCLNAFFPQAHILQALAYSNQMWALSDRLGQKSAIDFADEGEEQIQTTMKIATEEPPSHGYMNVNLAQLSDCFEVLWVCYVIALVCLMLERFLKSRELLQKRRNILRN